MINACQLTLKKKQRDNAFLDLLKFASSAAAAGAAIVNDFDHLV